MFSLQFLAPIHRAMFKNYPLSPTPCVARHALLPTFISPSTTTKVTSHQQSNNYLGQAQFRGEKTEIWLVRVVVALAAILQPGFCTPSKESFISRTTINSTDNQNMSVLHV
jgi:hypothetical protein